MADLFNINKQSKSINNSNDSYKMEKELRDEIAKLKIKLRDVTEKLNTHLTLVNRSRGDITTNVLNQTRKLVEESNTELNTKVDTTGVQLTELKEQLNTYIPPYNVNQFKIVGGKLSLIAPFSKKNTKVVNGEREIIALSTNTSTITGEVIKTQLETIQNQLTNALYKLDNINGFVTSNNFKCARPTDIQLTNFVIIQLSNQGIIVTEETIPNGTKIKNTFDNHIWLFNNIVINGINIHKWEDLGSDNICIANNKGVKGLVTGSEERYRGYIDMNGVISINGLEEELNLILESISVTLENLQKYETDTNIKIQSFEERLRALENK